VIPLLILVSLLAFVAGELLLKLAVNKFDGVPPGDPERKWAVCIFAASILSMSVTFFVNLGLLQKLELSYLFPFQGLSVIIIAFTSAWFLKERLTPALVTGVILITVGVILVSSS